MTGRRPRFFWRLHALYLVLTLGIALAASEFAARGIRKFYLRYASDDLVARTTLAADLMREHLPTTVQDQAAFDALVKRLGEKAATRLTVVDTNGTVLADSAADPATMENHGRRLEIREALAGRTGRDMRFSASVRSEMMYVAQPLVRDGGLAGAVRSSIPMDALDSTLREFQRRLLVTSLVFGSVAYVLVLLFLRRITRPIDEMLATARKFAAGDLSARTPAPNYEELGTLADALNGMATELGNRLDTIRHQRDEIESILASMREAVIAIDSEEHVLQVNTAARSMLLLPAEAPGRLINEVVRNSDLVRIVRETLTTGATVDGDVLLHHDNEERALQVNTVPLRKPGGAAVGVLLVANDVTHLRRLETVRRDFVANVSHELKTPLTSIKGFVEALQDGALEEPEEARRFVGIIARQVERLQDVLSDLLSLSRIEQHQERKDLRFQPESLRKVLDEAVEVCQSSAVKKNIAISIECPAAPVLRMNAALLEQAAVNLIDNAVKYSNPGTAIRIRSEREPGGGWAIHFVDQGAGIEPLHLPRIFERFYRVDKSRSRSDGGTGLGLSIVNHIMLAHGGRVSVESVPGQGSTFTLHLPPELDQSASAITTTG